MTLPLVFDQVQFYYGQQPALDAFSLEVFPGDFCALVGPNSSGKSTVLKLMSGHLRPASGRAVLFGRSLETWGPKELARTVAVVSSEEYFIFPFTVEQIVAMGRAPYLGRFQGESVQDRALVQEAMEATDIAHLKARAIHALSSGERQRVLLARALAQQPRVLLLDEPTAHLDIGHEWALFDLLARLHRAKKLTVVCALHDLTLAARYANRIVLLKQGKALATGNPSEVFQKELLSTAFGTSLSVSWAGASNEVLVLNPQIKGKST